MNKKIGFALIALVVFSFLISSASALYYNPRQGMNDLINGVVDFSEPLLSVLLGSAYGGWSGYLLFEKLMLFIILVSLVYVSLKNVTVFSNNKSVLWIIAITVPLIGVRFLDFMWLNTIFIQYKILAIALTAGLPFIIYFLFLYKGLNGPENATLRKIAWIFFGAIYLGLWSTGDTQGYPEIYLWTAFLSLIFFLLDGTINRYFTTQRIEYGVQMSAVDKIAEIDEQIETINSSHVPQNLKDARIRDLMKDRRKWEKYLS